MNAQQFDEQLELFYGAANANTATVYARLRGVQSNAGFTLSGNIRGPHCLHSTMLPATIRLADAGPGDGLLAKGLVPDPCYWSPDLPALYDVHVELKQAGEVIATVDRLFGMRQFGPRGKFFYLGGKRWTLRAAFVKEAPADLLAWHDAPLSLCVDCPSDSLCDEASRVGVLVVALLNPDDDLEAALRRLARHAAVGMVVLNQQEAGEGVADTLQQFAPNVVLAQACNVDEASEKVEVRTITSAVTSTVPVIAKRLLAESIDPANGRLACDRLQADLAPLGDFAGYLV